MRTVLLIDDDLDLLDMTRRMVEAHDMKAFCQNNGENLLHLLDTTTIDVIVMDIFLGSKDGRSICRDIKLSEQHSGTPVLLYSAGYISEESIRNSLADAYLTKPFDMKKFISLINELINKN